MKGKRKILFALTALLGFMLLLAAAACSPSRVKLSFETNGGAAVESVETTAGTVVPLPTPVREGYVFDGWYPDVDLSGEACGETVTAEKSATYYAKWTAGYRLTLDANGGTLSTAALWLREGDSLQAAVAGLTPVREGAVFGAWFLGEDVLASQTMPASDLTLTAKYRVDYLVEVYLANVRGTAYVRSDADAFYGTGYIGTAVEATAPVVANFYLNEEPQSGTPVSRLVLSEKESENVFRFYFDRMRYAVSYAANAPAGTIAEGTMSPTEAPYEAKTALAANAFTVEGYRFAGWSTRPDGDVEYTAESEFETLQSVTLYAVWDRGYTDRLGGTDLLFFPRLAPTEAILSRGGVEFKGVRDGDAFTFRTDAWERNGKVFGSTFCYADDANKGEYRYFENNPIDPDIDDNARLHEDIVLTVDEYMQATYRNGGHSCVGSVEFDGLRGDYLFRSDDHSFHFLTASAENTEIGKDVFYRGGEEAGVYIDLIILDAETGAVQSDGYFLVLDGYGNLQLTTPSEADYYGYYYTDGTYGDSAGDVYYKINLLLNDADGALTGAIGWHEQYLYTRPLRPTYGGYVFADGYRGDYEGTDGGTLTLDGYSQFADSAKYTAADGKSYQGSYTIEERVLDGTILTISRAGTALISLKLDPEARSVEPFTDSRAPHTEYRRLTDGSPAFPLLVLYETDDGMTAELYREGNNGVPDATGTVTQERQGNVLFYTFTDGKGNSLKFYTISLVNYTTQEAVNVYCVLEENGEKKYETIPVTGGGELWNTGAALGSGGTLYFTADGQVFEGGLSYVQSANFEMSYAEFLYADEQAGEAGTLYFLIDAGRATLIGTPELMLYGYIEYIPDSGIGDYEMTLCINCLGDALYYDFAAMRTYPGTYKTKGKTTFGEDIYTFTATGTYLTFDFLIHTLEEYGDEYLFYEIYDRSAEGTFRSDAGEVLLLDGFYRGRYTDAAGAEHEGTYSLKNDLELAVRFETEDGAAMVFSITKGFLRNTFRAVDYAYGTAWVLTNSAYEPVGYQLVFDGQGNLTANREGGARILGYYEILNAENNEYLLHIDLPGLFAEDLLVTLMENELLGAHICVLYDRNVNGVFVDGDWNILRLDGYGYGDLVTDREETGGSGLYTVLDEEKGFVRFSLQSADGESDTVDTFVALDYEKKSFRFLDYAALGAVYLSADLKVLVFGEDGTGYLGSEAGFYFAAADKTYFYLDSPTEGVYECVEMNALTGAATFEYGGVTYYKWDGEEIVLDGTIELFDEEGNAWAEKPTAAARLTFTPNGRYNNRVEAVLSIDGEQYSGFRINFYVGDAFEPSLVYNGVQYDIVSCNYIPNGAHTFTVRAGAKTVRYLDYNSRYIEPGEYTNVAARGGWIERTTMGIGPVEFREATYKGSFYYLYDAATFAEPITFDGETAIVIGWRRTYDETYEIVFDYEGTRYAVDFYFYESNGTIYYLLHQFYTYEEVDAGEYTVGVKYFRYTNLSGTPGYGDAEAYMGRAVNATVFRKSDQKPMIAFDNYTALGLTGRAVWLIECSDEKADGTRDAADGFFVQFELGTDGKTVTGATVTRHTVLDVRRTNEYYVHLFLDEAGNIAHVAAAGKYSNGSYRWITRSEGMTYNADKTECTFQTVEEVRAGGIVTEIIRTEYRFTFTRSVEGNSYTMTATEERK